MMSVSRKAACSASESRATSLPSNNTSMQPANVYPRQALCAPEAKEAHSHRLSNRYTYRYGLQCNMRPARCSVILHGSAYEKTGRISVGQRSTHLAPWKAWVQHGRGLHHKRYRHLIPLLPHLSPPLLLACPDPRLDRTNRQGSDGRQANTQQALSWESCQDCMCHCPGTQHYPLTCSLCCHQSLDIDGMVVQQANEAVTEVSQAPLSISLLLRLAQIQTRHARLPTASMRRDSNIDLIWSCFF